MLTFCLILACVFAAVVIIGGVAMIFDKDADFFTWYFGARAIEVGFGILAKAIPAILEAIASD